MNRVCCRSLIAVNHNHQSRQPRFTVDRSSIKCAWYAQLKPILKQLDSFQRRLMRVALRAWSRAVVLSSVKVFWVVFTNIKTTSAGLVNTAVKFSRFKTDKTRWKVQRVPEMFRVKERQQKATEGFTGCKAYKVTWRFAQRDKLFNETHAFARLILHARVEGFNNKQKTKHCEVFNQETALSSFYSGLICTLSIQMLAGCVSLLWILHC